MPRILVVDDEVQIRELLREAFDKRGYATVSVPSSEQALERLFQEPFDLVLLDMRLSAESGISILKKIKESGSKIPVVIYSGALTAELEKEARIAGAREVLSKNIDVMQLAEQVAKILRAESRTFQHCSGQKKSILIVDDESEVRHVLRDFFKKKGYQTLEAENGEEALRLVRSEEVSVALLDIHMPGMDGLTTLGRLREIKPNLGVVMVTAVKDDEQIKEAMNKGAYSYVIKPFDFLYLELVVMSKLRIAEAD